MGLNMKAIKDTNAVVDAEAVYKKYGDFTALDGVNMKIESGRIVGLIGPNGAGKTTLLKGILGLSSVDGQLQVLGLDPVKERTKLLEQVSFIADTAILPRWLKVKQAVDYVAGVHPKFDRSKAEYFLEKTNIRPNSRVGQLSKGMVTQLHLALVMAIDSKLLVLDEPTLGLDIIYRKEFYSSLLEDYFDENKTILITTHQVEEIENILTDVIFIDQGRLVLNTPMEDISNHFCQLSVSATKKQEVLEAGFVPMHEIPRLGGSAMLFEGASVEALSAFGEVTVPAIADLFVAKVSIAHMNKQTNEEVA